MENSCLKKTQTVYSVKSWSAPRQFLQAALRVLSAVMGGFQPKPLLRLIRIGEMDCLFCFHLHFLASLLVLQSQPGLLVPDFDFCLLSFCIEPPVSLLHKSTMPFDMLTCYSTSLDLPFILHACFPNSQPYFATLALVTHLPISSLSILTFISSNAFHSQAWALYPLPLLTSLHLC